VRAGTGSRAHRRISVVNVVPSVARSWLRYGAAPPERDGELERWVAAQWAELLGAADGDFFECGGDSITAMQLAARIRRDFGVALTVRTIFANATVALLAEYIADRQLAETDPAELLELLAQVERS
jgi:aryl carrier-like protein